MLAAGPAAAGTIFNIYNGSGFRWRLDAVTDDPAGLKAEFSGSPPQVGSVIRPGDTMQVDLLKHPVSRRGAKLVFGAPDYPPAQFNAYLDNNPTASRCLLNSMRFVCKASGSTVEILDHPSVLAIGTGRADTLIGGPKNDSLQGMRGNDILDGGPGNDSLSGGPGNDLIVGGPGRDTLDGGPGADTLIDLSGPTLVLTGTAPARGQDDVNVRDGRGDDTVVCGSRRSTVVADPGDRLIGHCGAVIRRITVNEPRT